jgi:hypothetical protein
MRWGRMCDEGVGVRMCWLMHADVPVRLTRSVSVGHDLMKSCRRVEGGRKGDDDRCHLEG